jgi:hypothetical protein
VAGIAVALALGGVGLVGADADTPTATPKHLSAAPKHL